MRLTTEERPAVHFLTSGPVTDAQRSAAEHAVRAALAGITGEGTSARITLSVVADSALPRPALAQTAVELDGLRFRAQAAAPTLDEAIDLMGSRLRLKVTPVHTG